MKIHLPKKQQGLPAMYQNGTWPAGQVGFSSSFLLLIAALGLLAFIIFAQTVPLGGNLFGTLYPKPESQAAPPQKTFPATLTLIPNPAPTLSIVAASGSRYYPSSQAYVNVITPTGTGVITVYVNSSGNLSFSVSTSTAGTYTVKVYQYSPKGGKLTQMSQTPLDVVQLSP